MKELYVQLGLPSTYATYEEESYNIISTHIQQVSRGMPHKLFFKFMEKIYKRECWGACPLRQMQNEHVCINKAVEHNISSYTDVLSNKLIQYIFQPYMAIFRWLNMFCLAYCWLLQYDYSNISVKDVDVQNKVSCSV